jgi:hypothetical protein
MNNKSTKYMEALSTLGYFIGFPILIYYSLTRELHFLVAVALICIIGFRVLGYVIDRIKEKE